MPVSMPMPNGMNEEPGKLIRRFPGWGESQLNAMMESCFGKSAISGVMGFGMGGLFGMFMASVRSPPHPSPLPSAPPADEEHRKK